MPEGGFLCASDGLLSWELYAVAAAAVAKSFFGEVDQEDTLLIQLTTPEVGLVCLGALLASRIFPELYGPAIEMNRKLIEVSDTQDFFKAGSTDEGE